MITLSQRIATLQAALALYGDVGVFRFDMEGGFDETFTEPEVCKLIDGDVVSQFDFNLAMKTVAQREGTVASIDEAWEKLPTNLQESWGSKAKLVEALMCGINRAERIVADWPTATVVLVI